MSATDGHQGAPRTGRVDRRTHDPQRLQCPVECIPDICPSPGHLPLQPEIHHRRHLHPYQPYVISDPVWHASSRSGEGGLTNCYTPFTFTLPYISLPNTNKGQMSVIVVFGGECPVAIEQDPNAGNSRVGNCRSQWKRRRRIRALPAIGAAGRWNQSTHELSLKAAGRNPQQQHQRLDEVSVHPLLLRTAASKIPAKRFLM